MRLTKRQVKSAKTETFANRFSAIGAEPRLRIMACLVSAPQGRKSVGEIQEEMGIPASTLFHHLEKLRHEDLVTTHREGSFLWYKANAHVLAEMMGFLSFTCHMSRGKKKSQPSAKSVATGLANTAASRKKE